MKRRLGVCVALAQIVATTCLGAASADLFDAVRAGDAEKVQRLLKADAKLAEARTEDGNTALHVAALEGQAAVATVLLKAGAQVNARGLREETPLHMAMYDGKLDVAELLIAAKADVDPQNSAGETPLHIAARKNHRDLVTLLMRENADPNARDKAGRTPKAAATAEQHWEVVELLTPRVGDLHDLRRMVFEGAKTFTADELRDGLRNAREFFEFSHPLASQESFLEAIQQKLLFGYQHAGFAEARIDARADARDGRVVVKVQEGPRYVCGEVKVSGTQKLPAAAITERLTTLPPSAQAGPRAYVFKDRAPATNPLTRTLKELAEEDEAFWVKGKPAPFSAPDLSEAKETVTELMRGSGFMFASVNARMVLNTAARTVELQVDVVEEGPRAVIGTIDVAGNVTNSTEAVLRCADLKPGMELTAAALAAAEERLWRSGRFLSYKIDVGTAALDGPVPLRIELVEYGGVTPLAQELSREEQALMRLREWLVKLDQGTEDCVITVAGLPAPAPYIEIVISPRNGFLVCLKEGGVPAGGREEYALVMQERQAAFYSLVGNRKLLGHNTSSKARTFLQIESNEKPQSEGPFHMSLGAGLTSRNKDRRNPAPYQFELTLPPVATFGLVSATNRSAWFDGGLLIQSNDTRLLKLDAATGRLVEFRARYEDGHEAGVVRFEPGAFERAWRRIEVAATNSPNLADAGGPLSSFLGFACTEACSFKYLSAIFGSNELTGATSHLPALLNYFRPAEVFSPLDRLVTNTNAAAADQEEFTVPNDLSRTEATVDDVVAVITGWVLRYSDELFGARTWPWTLLHEAGLVLQHKHRYTEQALAGIYDSVDTGPVGCLVAARLLAGTQPPLARKFAARGLERLTAADFRRDWSLFLEGDAVASQCCRKLAAALRDLNDAQAAELAKLQSPEWGGFVQDCRRRLRDGGDKPMTETLAPALDAYWEGGLKAQVSAALKALSFDPASAFTEGLAAYRSESGKAEAVKLFTQAAANGHPGAQYYLAMLYEQGAGVGKDVAKALEYYRQSATNGYAEAAVVVGNYYSEGFAVPPDPAEAYVWYSVAAARGNRLADVFRSSAKRKLTPPQQERAEQELKGILSNLKDTDSTDRH